jgi:hypothetical protein
MSVTLDWLLLFMLTSSCIMHVQNRFDGAISSI